MTVALGTASWWGSLSVRWLSLALAYLGVAAIVVTYGHARRYNQRRTNFSQREEDE